MFRLSKLMSMFWVECRKVLRGNVYIYTIGDSHSMWGFKKASLSGYKIRINYIGPILMYSVGQRPEIIRLKNFKIRRGGIVIFCFGEIDCRCHINKHITKEVSYKKIIDMLVAKYMKSIKMATSVMDVRVCVYNVLPPVKSSDVINNPNFPFIGTDQERREYTTYMNTRLKEWCDASGYIFFDIYKDCCDQDGFIYKDFADDVHLENPKPIEKFIINNLSFLQNKIY